MVKPVKSLKFKDPKTKQYGEDTPIGADAINVDYKEINVEEALDNIKLEKSGNNIVLTKPNGEQDLVFVDTPTNNKKAKKVNQEERIILFNDLEGGKNTDFEIEDNFSNYYKLDIYLSDTYGAVESIQSIILEDDIYYNLGYFSKKDYYTLHFIEANFYNSKVTIRNTDGLILTNKGTFEESYLASTRISKIVGYKK